MSDPTLFDQPDEFTPTAAIPNTPRARNTDPDTSHQAAQKLSPERLSADRSAVLLWHLEHAETGGTDFELAAALGRQQTSLGVRRADLVKAGWIDKTDMRRPSPAGSPAIVWKINRDGLLAAGWVRRRDEWHTARKAIA